MSIKVLMQFWKTRFVELHGQSGGVRNQKILPYIHKYQNGLLRLICARKYVSPNPCEVIRRVSNGKSIWSNRTI